MFQDQIKLRRRGMGGGGGGGYNKFRKIKSIKKKSGNE